MSNKIYHSVISVDDPILKGHSVHGQAILPGLAYIDMLFQLAKGGLGLVPEQHILRKLSIIEPLVVTEQNAVKLAISFQQKGAYWQLLVSGTQQGQGASSEERRYAKAELHPLMQNELKPFEAEKNCPAKINFRQMKKAAKGVFDMDTIYNDAAQRGLSHSGMIRAQGQIYFGEKQALIELKSEADEAVAEDYLFHPGLIDAAAMASGCLFNGRADKTTEGAEDKANGEVDTEEEALYLPLFYDAFYGQEALGQACYAYVPHASVSARAEIITVDIAFYNRQGKKIALLTGITSKKLRHRDFSIPSEPVQSVKPLNNKRLTRAPVAVGNLENTLREIFARYTQQSAHAIDLKAGFFEMGLESSQLLGLMDEIEIRLGLKLEPILLFQYGNLGEVINYLAGKLPKAELVAFPYAELDSFGAISSEATPVEDGLLSREYSSELNIAIVGLAGRYPQAKDLNAFWNNLCAGKDCITEIPSERWDWREYYSEEKNKPGHCYTNRGGFIEGMEYFDARFFNVPPAYAVIIDPQERLFLEHCWMALEDAAYTPEELNTQGPVGVYVGVMYQDYPLYASLYTEPDQRFGLGSGISSVANRVSYFCDFEGPSMAVDTACSSSLTAIYLACQDLITGQIKTALAGGVSLSIHPNKYLMLCHSQFLSKEGACRSFAEGGDGYVPGEGVGVAVLKRLEDAEGDHDQIYGVIKGCAINHGGRASGYTVPNPKAQYKVIAKALKQANIPLLAINYIEAHGTGTSLGDPIEINGLSQAFNNYQPPSANQTRALHTGSIHIGSVKSNIGHCESAAGIAGLSKILLQLKHQTLVPSLHSSNLNPIIDFANSPFSVQQTLQPWKRAQLDDTELPRSAGLSSFGAGGANGHLIVQEYRRDATQTVRQNEQNCMIVLSAKNQQALKQRAEDLTTWLGRAINAEANLVDIAYSLQVGREAMSERLAFTATSLAEINDKLALFLSNESEGIYLGDVKKHRELLGDLLTDPALLSTVDVWLQQKNYGSLLSLWVKGLDIDWQRLYPRQLPYRLSLPSYPFNGERYWIADKAPSQAQPGNTVVAPAPQTVHQLSARWVTTQPEWRSVWPEQTTSVLLVGAESTLREKLKEKFEQVYVLALTAEDSIETLQQRIKGLTGLEHIIWLGAEAQQKQQALDLNRQQAEQGVLSYFRLIKVLLALGYGTRNLGWTVMVQRSLALNGQWSDPQDAGLLGLVGSQAKEYRHWSIRLLDLDNFEFDTNVFIENLWAKIPADPRGEPWVLRAGQWYRRELMPVQSARSPQMPYRQGGVYIIIGGAGGLGRVWTSWLIRHSQAQVVWLGRRALDNNLQAQREACAGKSALLPDYFQVDASDQQALAAVFEQVKRRYGTIHGVIHAAIVLEDKSLGNMSEEVFCAALNAKVGTSLAMAAVLDPTKLDFVLFFSSLQSHVKAAGQSNYAAGCTFQDALSQWMDTRWPCAVKTINWGYWGEVGIVASEAYRTRAAQGGLGSIELPEALEAVEQLMGGPLQQLTLIKTAAESVNTVAMASEKRGTKADYAFSAAHLLSLYPSASFALTALYSQFAAEPLAPVPAAAMAQLESWAPLEAPLAAVLWHVLSELALFKQGNWSLADALQSVQPGYRRWLTESLRLLQAQNLVQLSGDKYSGEAPGIEAWQHWREAVERQQQTGRAALIERTLKALPDILKGQQRATDILFAKAQVSEIGVVYQGNPVADYFNDCLCQTLARYAKHLQQSTSQKTLRVLELGAGTGGSTTYILASMAELGIGLDEYCYTDISKAFLQHGQRQFGDKPFMRYTLFNIERSPTLQDISLDHYDVVIASNVVHATRNIRESLQHIKCVLKSGGMLLLNEMSNSGGLYNHLSFGLLEGWWRFEDDALRIQGCPGLSEESWVQALTEEGYVNSLFPASGELLGSQIVVAFSDGVAVQVIPQKLQQADKTAKNISLNQPLVTSAAGEQNNPKAYVRSVITKRVAAVLQLSLEEIDSNDSFADYGVDSIIGVGVVNALNEALQIDLDTTILYDYTTINALSIYIVRHYAKQVAGLIAESALVNDRDVAPITETENLNAAVFQNKPAVIQNTQDQPADVNRKSDIAIIGASCRYAQTESLEELWQHLAGGCNLTQEVQRWDLSEYFPSGSGLSYCNRGSFLSNIDMFDPVFFGISGVEATYMDPQQRLFLEQSWRALEDAGYLGESIDGTLCGVYVGASMGDYIQILGQQTPAQAAWGNSSSALPARISYYLNLQGPAISVDTACSSSLVAIHLACQGLWGGETEMAIAGGVSVRVTPAEYITLNRAGMLSPNGNCFTFDSRADGFVPGEGVGVVVLKRLEDALADGDRLYGVIRGSGINQDGASNGIGAPSALSQQRLEESVYRKFAINPADIQMVEAHGTGTILGDPIEFNALKKSFSQFTDKKQYCAIGSIKTNLGHTTTAAGVAGVLKVILALKHKKIPPTLNYQQINPNINIANSPFYVNTSLSDWPALSNEQGPKPRSATVSAFGMSGTNAHLVIEEALYERVKPIPQPAYLFVLSAKSPLQLQQLLDQYQHFLTVNTELDLADICYTLRQGRVHFAYRFAGVVSSVDELLAQCAVWNFTAQANEQDIEKVLSETEENYLATTFSTTEDDELYKNGLQQLADCYLRGFSLSFSRLLLRAGAGRIALPGHPFERDSYWVSHPDTQAPTKQLPLQTIAVDSQPHAAGNKSDNELDEEDAFYDQLLQDVIDGKACIASAVKRANKFDVM